MRDLAKYTIAVMLLSLLGARPCSCEIRQRLTDAGASHDCCCCGSAGNGPESAPTCAGCGVPEAERGAGPRCGGQLTTAGVVDRDGTRHGLMAAMEVRSPGDAPVPHAPSAMLLDAVPSGRPAVLSTVMRC